MVVLFCKRTACMNFVAELKDEIRHIFNTITPAILYLAFWHTW
jgi:hypothetical protein